MKRILSLLGIYAITMALLEAAVVVYMRRLYYPDNPLELFPLQFLDHYDPALELSREVATVVMILAVAFLAQQKTLTRHFAAFVFVFGVWDLFYYVWLKILIDWPQSWWEWDVLFLIPNVWLGPWICPAAIAVLFILWGSWTLLARRCVQFTLTSFSIFTLGASLGVASFMQPASSIPQADLREYVPGVFWWSLYGASYILMVAGFAMTGFSRQQTTVQDG